MYRGNLSTERAPWIAYDYRCVFALSERDIILIKSLPSLVLRKIKPSQEALAEIETNIREGYQVDVIFWEPKPKDDVIAKRLYKHHIKKGLISAPMSYCQSVYDIKSGSSRYEFLYTNRPELSPYFDSDFVRFTQFSNNIRLRNLNRKKLGLKWGQFK